VLAVARTLLDASAPHPYPAAGWASVGASARGGATSCTDPDAGTDAGGVDAGVGDAGPGTGGGGCACRAGHARHERSAFLALCGLVSIAWRLRDRRLRR
jgi:hypothetical protein